MKLHKKSMIKFGAAVGVLLLTCAMAVGTTQARYNNAVSWTGVYDPGVQTITSDYLRWEGQTVVLQSWEAIPGATRTENIQIFTSKDSAEVTMQCSSASEYISAEFEQSALQATKGGVTAKLKLTVTERARQLTEITQTKVSVMMKNADGTTALKADYRLTLIPQGENLPSVEQSDLVADLVVSPDEAEQTFAWAEKLVFTLAVEENADSIELMYNGGVFPKGTRYTVNLDQYVLGEAMTIRIPVSAGTPTPVSLDFSQTGLLPQAMVNITATSYSENKITDQINFTAQADRSALTIGDMDTNPVIQGSGSISIPMTGDQENLTILVQYLEKTNSGTRYVQSDKLSVQIRPDREGDGQYLLEIANPTGKATAGTYRLTLVRMCGDQLVSTCQMAFFVHY